LVTSFFAAAALLLASIGIYGVMAYSVSRRTTEIGIRLALGASGGQILAMVMRQGMALVLAGILSGIVLVGALGRALSSLLYGISAWSPVVYLGVALLLSLVAGLATAIPAWRATRIDPAIALRQE
jgi:putative ABC transport system permease protein